MRARTALAALAGLGVLAAGVLPALAQMPRPPAAPAAQAAANAVTAAPLAPARPGARLAPGQPIPLPELEAFVDGAVREARAGDHIAGVSVAVVQNGQTVLLKGYGFASLAPQRPVDPCATLFRLGSISKTFTWITLMKAVERGRMRLDAPVNRYLPAPLRIPDEGFDQPILLSHLMSHSAGFEAHELGRLFEADEGKVRPLDIWLQRNRPSRVRPPGDLSSYSNYGAALAGAAVSAVEGQAIERLAEAEVFQPLGMSRTSFREPHAAREGLPAPLAPDLAEGIATGFRWTGARYQARPFEHMSQLAPAGSASGTADDMSRFMLALLQDGRVGEGAIYSPVTARAFRTTLRTNAPGMNGWAHGLAEFSLPGDFRGFGHDGSTLSFATSFVTVPELGLGVFVATNTDTGARLAQQLPGRIVGQFYAGPREGLRPGSPDLATRRADYEGLYLSTRRSLSGLDKFVDRLSKLSRVDVTSDGRLSVSQGGRGRIFAPEGQPGRFIAADGEDRFVFTPAEGRSQAFFMPSGGAAAERVGWLHTPTTLALAGALAMAAALAVLAGMLQREQRDFRQARAQIAASRTQAVASILWLVAIAGFTVFVLRAEDPAWVMFTWPSPWLVAASATALAASLVTLVLVLQLGGVWRGERRQPGWSGWRKLRHTVTVAVFLGFAVVLAAWGALEPWSS